MFRPLIASPTQSLTARTRFRSETGHCQIEIRAVG
jgi:hypothetical protein